MGQSQCGRSVRDFCNSMFATDATLNETIEAFTGELETREFELQAQLSATQTALDSVSLDTPNVEAIVRKHTKHKKAIQAELSGVQAALRNRDQGAKAIEQASRLTQAEAAAKAQHKLMERNGVTAADIERKARAIQSADDSTKDVTDALRDAVADAAAAARLNDDDGMHTVDISVDDEVARHIEQLRQASQTRSILNMPMATRAGNSSGGDGTARNHNLKPIPKAVPAMMTDERRILSTNDAFAGSVAHSTADFVVNFMQTKRSPAATVL